MSNRYHTIIIGAGFGGLGLAIRMRQAGREDFLILEKSDGPGGVWRDNTYPGSGCDIPSHLYSFSFERQFDWSRRFPSQEEILRYLEYCTDRYGIRDHARFNTEVTQAGFNSARGEWVVETDRGETLVARVLVCATGQLNRPAWPEVPGLAQFRGHVFHSARWDHGHSLRDRRVAVVGTGASAIQFIPRIAPEVGRLYIFQRSAPWIMPKPDWQWRPWQRRLMRRLPLLRALDRLYLYLLFEMRVPGFTRMPWLMQLYRRRARRQLRRQVRDPALHPLLTPDYPMGCKRILISEDYLPALNHDHVELVPCGLREVRANSVVDEDGVEREVDTLILATGFRATEFLSPIRLVGHDGVELNEAWRDGAEAYKGITVHGFPNLFLLYGPNTNLGHNSIVYMLESQIRYVLRAMALMDREQLRWMEVRHEAQQRFVEWVHRRMERTVWQQGCSSWYRTETGRNTNNWPGSTLAYRLMTRKPDPGDYLLVAEKDEGPLEPEPGEEGVR